MNSLAFEERVAAVKRRAHGHWTELLATLGVDERILNRRNQPCPLCGGDDRFQYTDKFGEGNYHCRHCGAGGGLKLLQGIFGWDFLTMLDRLEHSLGSAVNQPMPLRLPSSEPSAHRMKKLAKRLWEEAHPIGPEDAVDRYLRQRGLVLNDYPKVLRCHPALGYFERDGAGKLRRVTEYPAMLACIQGNDGHAVTLHRTYLDEARKAPVSDPKRVLSGGITGAAIRLFDATDELAIAEGIETALAVHLATGKPVWAAVHAGNLEKFWLPATVRRIGIYADNDGDTGYDGQACAFALARRLKKEESHTGPRQVAVFVPRRAGSDWADVWQKRVDAGDLSLSRE